MTNSTTSRRSGELVILLLGGVLLACGGGGATTGGPEPTRYSLTLQVSGDGSTTPAPGTSSYTSGTVVEVTATPASGSVFAGWSGAATGTSSPVSVTMDGDKTLTAAFEVVPAGRYALTVSKAGTGTGSVTGPGIDCGTSCTATYASGTLVTLTATPSNGSTFSGWSGACSGTATCTVTLDAAKAVTATFAAIPPSYALTVSKAGAGAGTVTGSGIDCGVTCSVTYASGTLVTLTATPANGSTFSGWSGVCSGTGTCTVTLDAAKAVTATFAAIPPSYTLTVSKAGAGSGRVTGSGIDCGVTCSASYTGGTVVTLTATPSNDSTFSSWSGACSGTAGCTVTLNAATAVTATFALKPPQYTVAMVQAAKTQATDLTTADIASLVSSAVTQAGGLGFIQDGQTVVLKPNLLTAYTDGVRTAASPLVNGIATDWRVVKAVADLVRARDPSGKILVMEGSVLPTPTAYSMLGYTAANFGTSVDEFIAIEGAACNDKTTSALEQRTGPSGTRYWVNSRYVNADVVISLPAMKTHNTAGITGAVKNLGIGTTPVGIYSGANASTNCTRGQTSSYIDHSTAATLGQFIRDYYGIRPPDFVVMDALQGLQHGPLPAWDNSGTYTYASSRMNMRLVLAGRNAVAVDTIAALVMECDPTKVPHLTLLEADGLGTTDTGRITVVGKQVAEVARAFASKQTAICSGQEQVFYRRPGSACRAGTSYPAPVLTGTPGLVYKPSGTVAGTYEGPVWLAASSTLLFSDISFTGSINPSQLFRLTPPSTVDNILADAGLNGMAVDAGGHVYAASHKVQGIVTVNPSTGAQTTVVDNIGGKTFNSPNDLVLRSDGAIYFTDPDFQLGSRTSQTGQKGVYRLNAGGAVSLVDGTFAEPNGIALSPDETVLYVADYNGNVVRAFTVAIDGSTSGRRDFATVTTPDGLAMDCLGNLYVASGTTGTIQVFSPGGTKLGSIGMGAGVTGVSNLAFGGTAGKTLYITAGKALYSLDMNLPGYFD